MDSDQNKPVDRDELMDALGHVCADPVFARAPQLRRLLDYLVQCALAGEYHPKEYTIAVEALGRSADFDSDHDSIVRVQAGRLRRALDKYYTGPGKRDRVRIDLPVGSYGIACRYQDVPIPTPTPPRPRGMRAVVFAGFLVLIIFAFLMPAFRGGSESDPPSAPPAAGPAIFSTSNGLPLIVIEPYDGPGAAIDAVPALNGLRRKIASALSRFETVRVIYRPRIHTDTARTDGQRPIADERIYSLSTILGSDKSRPTVLFQLANRGDGTVAWTGTFDLPGSDDVGSGQDGIARNLATTLAQPFGVIHSRERTNHLRTGDGDPRYRCILEAAETMRDATNEGYVNARACLERVIESDPSNLLAHTYLASILNRIYQFGWPVEPGILDRALTAARRAVHINPASARAHFALFLTRFNMREFDAADETMAQARALNDDDLVMRSVYGGRLVMRGRIDEGMAILDEVGQTFPARYCSHGFYVFLGHYLRGYLREAHRHAHELTCPSYPFAFLAKALATHDADKPEIARRAIDSVAVLLPGWRDDPRAALGRTIPDAVIVERILRDLAADGLIVSAKN